MNPKSNFGSAAGHTWFRAVVEDTDSNSAARFSALIRMALNHVPAKRVITDRLELVPPAATNAIAKGSLEGVDIEELIGALSRVTQLVWGRFYFFHNVEDAGYAKPDDVGVSIARSQFTICAVDNTSFFVFTQSKALVSDIMARERAEVAEGTLSEILSRAEDF